MGSSRSQQNLQIMQRRWAERPETPAPEHMNMPRPGWVKPVDPLYQLTPQWRTLYRVGEVLWGDVLIANELLWSPQDVIAPASLIFSFDALLQREHDRILPTLARLWQLREREHPAVPGERAVQALLKDPFSRTNRIRLPPALSGGRVIWLGDALIYPSQLPGRRLAANRVPILADRTGEITSVVALLPKAFWAPGLVEDWGE